MDSDTFHGRPSGYSHQMQRVSRLEAMLEEHERRIAALEAEREAGR